jgi:hypothetical protein
VVTGALSIVAPFFTVLTGTLGALGLAGWAAARRREGRSAASLRSPRQATGLVAVGAGAGVYLAAPAPFDPFRALLLALGLSVLWWAERGGRARGLSAKGRPA